tara:strand:+ start:23839 stop:24027 length:189 start_codon:yes stop_codon:yes gene_type:complete
MSKIKFTIKQDGIVNNTELYNNDRTTQQYVRTAVHTTIESLGFKVDEEWEMDDNSIEVTVTR